MIVLNAEIEHSTKHQMAENAHAVDMTLISQEASIEVFVVTFVIGIRFSRIKASEVVGIVERSIRNPSC